MRRRLSHVVGLVDVGWHHYGPRSETAIAAADAKRYSNGRRSVHMRKVMQVALTAFLSLGAASSRAADIQLTIQNGGVSLAAIDATVREVLAEWARIGQMNVVNADSIPDEPMTLRLENVPEGQALDILLRSGGGYIAMTRSTAEPNRSRYARIIVMATAPMRSTFQRELGGGAMAALGAAVGRVPGGGQLREGSAEWAGALDDPDPGVRIRALDTWAQQPQDTIDPATYALVDPDESVRARAQELLEEMLAHPR